MDGKNGSMLFVVTTVIMEGACGYIHAIHDGDEMLHGGCLGCGYLIVVVYQVKSGHRRHCDGQAKGVPPRRHGRGPRPMGPLRSVRVVGKANQMPMSLRRGSQTESTTGLPLSLFLLIATIHGRILRRGLPLPLPSTLPLPPLCSAAVVSCCFLLLLQYHYKEYHALFFTSLLQPPIGAIAPSTARATRCLFCLHP